MRGSGGAPGWLIIVVAVALVFGLYYLWLGLQNYIRTGGLGVAEATQRANIIETATADRVLAVPTFTPVPSFTPIPECQAFVVSVPSAIVREGPFPNAAIVDSLPQGSEICVIAREGSSEWYLVDTNPRTRRLERAFMHETVIEAVNPTPTITRTPTPLPTVTDIPTLTPSQTFTAAPTLTTDPNATATPMLTPTPTLTPSPTPTVSFESA